MTICICMQKKFDAVQNAKSRGELPIKFLNGNIPPLQYLLGINGDEYNGFNLVVGDLSVPSLYYLSNRGDGKPIEISAGLHGISNGLFAARPEWPRVRVQLPKRMTVWAALHQMCLCSTHCWCCCAQVRRVKEAFRSIFRESVSGQCETYDCPWEQVFQALQSTERPPDDELPDTGEA
jgi:uncharacterized protein with NRDE domain